MEHMKERTNEAPELDFESQFNKKEELEFFGSSLNFVDIFPERDTDSIPIFLAPGWAGDKMMFKEVLHSFYKKGRRVLSLSHPTHVKNPTIKDGTSLIEIRKAEAILAVIENSGVAKVDAVFYSEGGINGVLAATRRPEKFRNIILVDPGGFLIKDGVLKLMGRFIMEAFQLVKETIYIPKRRDELLEVEKEIVTYVTKNPIRTINEADAIAKEDVMEMLKLLHEKGIGTVIINSANDKVFPMDKMRKAVGRDVVDHFYRAEGSHFELLIEPGKYVDLIIRALDAEQNKPAQK